MNEYDFTALCALNFKYLRTKLGTQIHVSDLLGITQSTLSSYEKGKTSIPLYAVKQLCDLTETSVDAFSTKPLNSDILPSVNKLSADSVYPSDNTVYEKYLKLSPYNLYYIVNEKYDIAAVEKAKIIKDDNRIQPGVLTIRRKPNEIECLLELSGTAKAFMGELEISKVNNNAQISLKEPKTGEFITLVFKNLNINTNYIGGLALLITNTSDSDKLPCVQKVVISSKKIDISSRNKKGNELLNYLKMGLKDYQVSYADFIEIAGKLELEDAMIQSVAEKSFQMIRINRDIFRRESENYLGAILPKNKVERLLRYLNQYSHNGRFYHLDSREDNAVYEYIRTL